MRPVEKRIKDCLRVIEWSKVRRPNHGVGYPTLDEATKALLVFLNGPDMVSQRHVCAICENSAKLVIDHDHITGKVRGLLCNSCNTGIGFLGDSPKRLKKAITYLRKPQK